MCKCFILLKLTGFLLFFAGSAGAVQSSFEKREQAGQIHFSYEWLDQNQVPRKLAFTLDNQAIKSQFKRTTNYMPDIAQRFVYVEMQREAIKVDPREARIKIIKRPQDFVVEVNSRSPELIEKWQRTMNEKQVEALQRYLTQNYYAPYKNHLGQEAVKPDHIRYAMESRKILLPAAQAIYEQLNPESDSREYVNLLLSWVQSIPYNTLENRLISNGSGYFSPAEVIQNNLGDCDSKSTLTISLLRALLPDVPMVMIFLPDHALLGLSIPHRANEPSLELDGVEYMLVEPTGPALMRVGEVAASTDIAINSGMYTYEMVPLL